MQQWLAFPWVRYTGWLLAGILLAFAFELAGVIVLGLGMLAALLFVVAVFVLKKNNPAEQMLWGLLACIFLLALGFTRTQEVLTKQQPSNPQSQYWLVHVGQAPVKTLKSYRFRAGVSAAGARHAPIEAMVYLKAAQVKTPPEPGDVLLLKARLQEVAAPLNPYEFNNRQYMASQGIHYQMFASAMVQAAPRQTGLLPAFSAYAHKSRRYLLHLIESFIPEKEAASVVKALVLGDKTGLDKSLRQAYADAGVMHILAVSGLHVGMVFLIFRLIFRYFRKNVAKRILWLLLALTVLWMYAWLTGMAPSTMRAALMFSMIAIGYASRRSGNIYNSIAFSAFLLLVWDPLLIKQVGFQLSYLAVIGIVYLQPRISKWYEPKSWFGTKVWEMLSATLAAQLVTFPLGLYYFHQFPAYFFISNLLAIPLAFLIVYTTLFLMLLHLVPFLNLLLGWLLHFFAAALNEWVMITVQFPSSRLVGVINTLDVLLIYALMLSIILLFRFKQFSWAVCSFAIFMFLAFSAFVRASELRQQRQLTVYQIPGSTLLHFVQGQQEVLLPLGEKPGLQQLNFHVEQARLQAGLPPLGNAEKLPHDFQVPQQELVNVKLLAWNGLKIAVVEGGQKIELPKEKLEVDVLLLRRNPAISLEELSAVYSFKNLVVDASCHHWYRQKVEKAANSLHLPCHITSEQGAYNLQL